MNSWPYSRCYKCELSYGVLNSISIASDILSLHPVICSTAHILENPLVAVNVILFFFPGSVVFHQKKVSTRCLLSSLPSFLSVLKAIS